MSILVERYSDYENAEIKLQLPKGECFILTRRVDKDHYEVSVLIPWYGKQFYTGIDSTVIYDKLGSEKWRNIFDAHTSDLISIIRKALPIIKQLNREADIEI